ncbi:MAG TPA: hypothetical protein VIC60_12900 [Thermomicrobiales bacterium]|jgi:hypothetical protein
MADDRELAALKAQVAALEARARNNQGTQTARAYLVKTQVFDECWSPEPIEPPTEPAGGESVHARLDRIEEQLRRVIAKIEG